MLAQPLIDRILSDSAVKIKFDALRCLRSRFNKNTCTRCLEGCQSGALELHGGRFSFDAEKCTECMQCTAVCPNDAFAHNIDFLPMLDSLAAQETVLLSCEKGILNHNHITVPCIGILSEPILAAINSVARDDCFIDINRCAECTNSHCLQTLQVNMQYFSNKIGGQGKIRLKVHSDKHLPLPAGGKNERRSFLRLFRKNIAEMGKESMSFQLLDSASTKEPRRKKQARNASALQYALSIAPDERRYERNALLAYFFSVSTNAQCDCCPSCTGMCPTGALKRKKEKGGQCLTFTSANCSGCGLCESFCRKNALTLTSGFSGDPNVTQHIAKN
jgi:ferredoxin